MTDGSGGRRLARVAGQVQQELASLLLKGVLRGEGTTELLVSRVEMSPDLQLARVYVRLLDIDAPEKKRRRALAGLERGKGVLRREIGLRLGLRRSPELAFRWDEGVDHALRVDAILEEIRREQPEDGDAPDDPSEEPADDAWDPRGTPS